MSEKKYPVPGPTGGKLIREVIKILKLAQQPLPITSHILITTSGGPDSVALAHLIANYGRRVGDPTNCRLLHVNHGWRGKASDEDAAFVKALGKKLRLPTTVVKLPKPKATQDSLENEARIQRKAIFAEQAAKHRAIVLTAHHADDLAETVLWRLFTGTADTHGGGIAVRHGQEIRPFLTTPKQTLIQYLKEEGQAWREDSTNFEGRFLRSKMRLELMPVVQKLFPRAVSHLVTAALEAQDNPGAPIDLPSGSPTFLLGATGFHARRSHWNALQDGASQVDLPGGWRIRKENESRWVLEKVRSKG